MLKRCWLALLLLLAVLAAPGRAEAQYYFSLSDLEKLFVQDQQYFVLDDEGFGDPSVNHLHFSHIDTTTGNFTGYIWAPQIVPAIAKKSLPVSGTITINPDSFIGGLFGTGNYYGISFSWDDNSTFCFDQSASYTGAITFRGYRGGKMQANIAGSIDASWAECQIGPVNFSPIAFSGVLVK
ncbi:hypothetical protein GCM10011611_10750 [Aliidongia dinghuensis]|uniref:Uncharacterized protein n=1 Tax=Aliidongia dinghuensis TaxID=1867774 RepID=A0A8J2YQK0_9PROT|nr:hypothetical protein [Aliidongia dinghuensis]GGF07140.1 hypothetical protein GCM10011611_10750 [Aliidongia dinghuensis]